MLRGTEILFEGHAKNMRKMMGISGVKPKRIAHQRRLKAIAKAEAAETTTQTTGQAPAASTTK
jgi:hypothetical protein